jgi:hypothetical protein
MVALFAIEHQISKIFPARKVELLGQAEVITNQSEQ